LGSSPPVKAMNRYFATIAPLLNAIARKAADVGLPAA
jgi:hypothetical protein